MEALGIYLHIPFCVRKCQYCDFLSMPAGGRVKERYTQALCREIQSRSRELEAYEIRSVFWGGGTPSLLSAKQYERIAQTLTQCAPHWRQNAEWTVEANPGTVSAELAGVWRKWGANRVSLGAQAYQEPILRSLGRIHTWDQVVSSVELLRKTGFDNLNLDLMMGLPGQSLSDWRQTLEKAVELNPEHLSCYSLIIEEGTPFWDQYADGRLQIAEEEERQMYALTLELLEQKGYRQYEISNFAREGFSCLHNLAYWDLSSYRGLGLGASSYIRGGRIRNTDSLAEYCAAEDPAALERVEEEASLKNEMEEWMFLGLRRTEGVLEEEFRQRFHISPDRLYQKQLADLLEQGLIIRNEGRIRLSRRGLDFANLVFEAFLLETI